LNPRAPSHHDITLTLTLLTPFLNESQLLPQFLANAERALLESGVVSSTTSEESPTGPLPIEWILVDSGSRDDSYPLISSWLRTSPVAHAFRLVPADPDPASAPSIGRALNHALKNSAPRGAWLQVVPADCHLPSKVIAELLAALSGPNRIESSGHSPQWFALEKRYHPGHPLLTIYAALQNWVRLRALGRAVWTNGMGVRLRSLPNHASVFPTEGFMEDSLFCDELYHRFGRPRVLGYLEVSHVDVA
jgi:hypothetical protein